MQENTIPLIYTALKEHERQNLADVIPLAKPYTLIIEPTSLCNFRCVQCFQSLAEPSYFTATRGNMSLELFRTVIAQAASWSGPLFKVLKLSLYGEPLLNPDFPEMMRLAREANIAERIETTTNASLLNDRVIDAMIEQKLDYVRVSIYAGSSEKHAQITRSSVNLPRIHDNLLRLQQRKKERRADKPFVACKMLDTFGPENEVFKRQFQDVADEVYFDMPHDWIPVAGSDFLGGLYGDGKTSVSTDLHPATTRRRACPVSFYVLAVRANGDVAPCCVDFIGGTNVGNAKEHPLREIWQGEAMRAFHRMQLAGERFRNPSCARCGAINSAHYTRDNIDDVSPEALGGQSAGNHHGG
jgi:radical SAM protein with 4Fe4S-binding SPASM domain